MAPSRSFLHDDKLRATATLQGPAGNDLIHYNLSQATINDRVGPPPLALTMLFLNGNTEM